MPEVSKVARRLFRILVERPARYSDADLKRELGVSKTKLRAAFAELEEANVIHIEGIE